MPLESNSINVPTSGQSKSQELNPTRRSDNIPIRGYTATLAKPRVALGLTALTILCTFHPPPLLVIKSFDNGQNSVSPAPVTAR
jgi:hypothetical protein